MKGMLGTHEIGEENLLMLHRLLVTPGIHHICMSHQEFRFLLTNFFSFSSLYKNPGYISRYLFAEITMPYVVELAECMDLPTDRGAISGALSHITQCDFIWIEIDQQLVDQPWYKSIQKALLETSKKRAIPIMCVSSPEKAAL